MGTHRRKKAPCTRYFLWVVFRCGCQCMAVPAKAKEASSRRLGAVGKLAGKSVSSNHLPLWSCTHLCNIKRILWHGPMKVDIAVAQDSEDGDVSKPSPDHQSCRPESLLVIVTASCCIYSWDSLHLVAIQRAATGELLCMALSSLHHMALSS